MSSSSRRERVYIKPVWPDEKFFLIAIPDGWSMGPFGGDDFGTGEDGTLIYADGVIHPIVLRVRGQDGEVIHANEGSIGDKDYQIVPLSQAPPEWLGAAE